MMTTIEKMQQRIFEFADKSSKTVAPGMKAVFTSACQAGDTIRQGDLYLILVDAVPNDYVKAKKPNKQLVPGNTQGARHCLDALNGVTIYYPAKWDMDSLDGPCLILAKQRKVLHPVHGPVTLLPGTKVLCKYQREWSKEEAKERRTLD